MHRFFIAMLIYILGVAAIATISYWVEQQRYMLDIDARLLAAASNIPSILPTDFHDHARTKGSISSEQDKYNLELLSKHARTGDLTYLYSYVMDDEGMIYFTSCNYTQEDVEKDQVVTYWTSYPEGAQEYFDAMTATEPVYVTAGDRWGLFRTILIPMKSPSGLPYVAAADMDITVIEQSLLYRVWFVVGICLLMLLLVTPFVIVYRQTYSEMNRELLDLNRQLQDDIDQAMRLEDELKRATQEANVANDIKSQFLANMSHELRTPINGVMGMNDLLLDTNLSDEQREYTQLSHQSAKVLLDTVNQILDLARIESRGLTLKPEVIETQEFFDDIALLFAQQVAEKHLDLVIALDSAFPLALQVDSVRLRQVLINLIANAIKFTELGGVHVKLSWKDEVLSGVVTDSGSGIPDEAQSRIFDTFQQVDNTASRNYSGTGLGLPISLQICQAMQGDLILTSSNPNGSVFTFYVVALDAPDSSLVPVKLRSPVKALALALTDSGLIGEWLVAEFHSSNSVCKVVRSVGEGLVDIQSFNLILLDSKLGLEALTQLSEVVDLSCQRLVWLAWSGEHLPDSLNEKVDVLYKPLTRSRLITLSQIKGDQGKNILAQPKFTGRVLLVDDHATNLMAMSEQLKHMGLVVDHAHNGFQALQSCLEHQYDLVLMDIQMAEMDGLEATRQIRFQLAQKAPPIIGVSAHVMEDDLIRARQAGMTDYLTKPISKDSLLMKMAEFLS